MQKACMTAGDESLLLPLLLYSLTVQSKGKEDPIV